VFSFLRTLTTWHCPRSPVAAADSWPCSCRPIAPARRAYSSKPAAAVCCCGPMLGQTHGRTPYRYRDPALPHTTRVVSTARCQLATRADIPSVIWTISNQKRNKTNIALQILRAKPCRNNNSQQSFTRRTLRTHCTQPNPTHPVTLSTAPSNDTPSYPSASGVDRTNTKHGN